MKSFGVTIVLPRFIRSDEVRAFEMSVLKSFCGGKLTLAQSVERLALDCRAGSGGVDSRDRTNTQGLKVPEE